MQTETGRLKQPWFSFQRDWFMWEPSRAGSLCLKMPFQKWPWCLDCSLRNQCHLELSSNLLMAATSASLGLTYFKWSIFFFFAKNIPTLSSHQSLYLPLNTSRRPLFTYQKFHPPWATIPSLYFIRAKVDCSGPHWWLIEENMSWLVLRHCSTPMQYLSGSSLHLIIYHHREHLHNLAS